MTTLNLEKLRVHLRTRLGWNSRLYRAASIALGTLSTIRSEGLATTLRLRSLSRRAPDPAHPESIHFRKLAHPFLIRPGTKDIGTAVNNFVREEYGHMAPPSEPAILVDAGAYIGDTSAYFLSRYPGLTCIAFEPNPESLQMARRNLAPYGDRVRLLPMALTATGEPVRISGQQTSTRIDSSATLEVQSMSVPQILQTLPGGQIDILKLDIEGAEEDLFASGLEHWIGKVRFIIVETHGERITQTVLRALAAQGWHARRFRNLFYCWPETSST